MKTNIHKKQKDPCYENKCTLGNIFREEVHRKCLPQSPPLPVVITLRALWKCQNPDCFTPQIY